MTLQCYAFFVFVFVLHHRSLAVQTDKVCESIHFFKGDTADISSMVSGRFHFMAHLLVLCIYSIILSFHFFGGL